MVSILNGFQFFFSFCEVCGEGEKVQDALVGTFCLIFQRILDKGRGQKVLRWEAERGSIDRGRESRRFRATIWGVFWDVHRAPYAVHIRIPVCTANSGLFSGGVGGEGDSGSVRLNRQAKPVERVKPVLTQSRARYYALCWGGWA